MRPTRQSQMWDANRASREWRLLVPLETSRWQVAIICLQVDGIVCDALLGYGEYSNNEENPTSLSSRAETETSFPLCIVPLPLGKESSTCPMPYLPGMHTSHQQSHPTTCPTSLANNLHNPWESCKYPRSTPLPYFVFGVPLIDPRRTT